MLIIVGLGNPGNKYEHTRHNVGFDVIEVLSQKLNIAVKKIKCKCLVGEGMVNGEKVVLAKPQTYMNLSGQAVVELMQWYKVDSEEVLIIYDDIDLPLGHIRYRNNGSAGTHNGMRNIISLSPSNNFPRLRVGVGRPPHRDYDLADWVLSSYASKEEREEIFSAFLLAADTAIEHIGKDAEAARQYLSKQQANKGNEKKQDKDKPHAE